MCVRRVLREGRPQTDITVRPVRSRMQFPSMFFVGTREQEARNFIDFERVFPPYFANNLIRSISFDEQQRRRAKEAHGEPLNFK